MKKTLLLIVYLSIIQFTALSQTGCQIEELSGRVISSLKVLDTSSFEAFRSILISEERLLNFNENIEDEDEREEVKKAIESGFIEQQFTRMFRHLKDDIHQTQLDLSDIIFEDFLYKLKMRDGVKTLDGEIYFEANDEHYQMQVRAFQSKGRFELVELDRLMVSYELHGYPDNYEPKDRLEELMEELENSLEETVSDEEVTEAAVTIDDVHIEAHGMLPEYPGGFGAMEDYIYGKMEYPQEAIEKGIEGMVELRFKVLSDGSLAELKVLNSPDQLLTEEAIRIVKGMPNWIPAHQNGEPVATYFSLPIEFELSH